MKTIKTINKWLYLVVFCLIIFPIWSQNSLSDKVIIDGKKINLDIDTAVSLGLANNLGLQQEKIKFDTALWGMVTSWNTFMPTITTSGTFTRSNLVDADRKRITRGTQIIPIGTPTSGVYNAFYPHEYEVESYTDRWSLNTNLSVNLNLNAGMGFSVYQTVLDWKEGRLNLETTKKKLFKDIKISYYALIISKEDIAIEEQDLDLAEKRLNQARINYENGLIPYLDMLSAEVSYENKKPVVTEKRDTFANNLLTFKQMIGLKSEVEINFTSQIEPPQEYQMNVNQIVDDFLENGLEYKKLKLQIDKLQNKRNISISNLTPTFGIGYQLNYAFKIDPLVNAWIDNPQYMSDNWQIGGGLSFTLSVPISNLLPFSKLQTTILTDTYQIQGLKIGLENLNQQTELQVRKSIKTLQRTAQSYLAQQLNAERAEQVYKQADIAYRAGTKELLAVEEENKKMLSAKFNLLNTRFKFITSLLELEYLLNVKIDDLIQ